MPQDAEQFSGIFINYRRDDSSGHTGRLFDRLSHHFGDNQVFIDIDHIEPGVDFVDVLEDSLRSCDILITVIGRRWLLSSGGDSRRLDDPNDFVRVEIAAALNRNIRVIPVLVDGATMPKQQDLPEDLARLVRRQAIELSDQRWKQDVDRLISVLERALAGMKEAKLEAARKEAEEKQLRAAEEERRRQEEEERRRLEEEAAAARRREEAAALAAAEEKQRREAEEELQREAEAKRQAEELERERLEAEEAERQRLKDEEEERIRLADAAAREQKEREEEEQRQREAEARRAKEAERRRLQAEAAQRRMQEEAAAARERKRLEEEERLKSAAVAEAAAAVLAVERQKQREAEEARQREEEPERKQREAEAAEREKRAAEEEARARAARGVTEATPTKPEPRRETFPLDLTQTQPPALDPRILLVAAGLAVIVAGVGVVWWLAAGWGRTSNAGAPRITNTPAAGQPRPSPALPAAPEGMVYVPGGDFTMGRDDGDEYERPAHRETLKAFFIDAYEVTCGDYEKFVKEKSHPPPQGWKGSACPAGAARKPITGVTWGDAGAYCYARAKRLPTEQEWEFAARGTDGRRYPWGNEWRAGLANADGASNGMVDVGRYPDGKSPFGAFDMVGNAWEWTASDIVPYPGGRLPRDLPTGQLKVIRSGSYESSKEHATTTYRSGWPARGARTYSQTGFRCAKDTRQ